MNILNRLFKKKERKKAKIYVRDPKGKIWIPLEDADNLNIRDSDQNNEPEEKKGSDHE